MLLRAAVMLAANGMVHELRPSRVWIRKKDPQNA
jgi:hypothetical protein